MPDTLPCPTCRATLRVPAGAELIRCPRCKTEISVPAPGRPAIAVPVVPKPPVAPPAPVRPPVSVIRGVEAAPRPRRGGPNALELYREEQDDKQDRLLEALDETARPARTGVRLLAFGAVATCASGVLFFLGQFVTFAVPALLPLILIGSGAFMGLHWLLCTAGFAYCCAGPRPMRPMAFGGVAVMVLHFFLTIPLALSLAALINLENVGFNNLNGRDTLTATLLLSNLFNNLTTITDLPLYLLSGAIDKPQVLALPFLGGMFEFAKLVLMGLLTHNYCVLGKDPELAHQGLRFVYRIFWVVILGAVLKIGFWLFIRVTGGEPLLLVWFSIPIMFVTNGYFMWTAFAWYAQCRVMMDAVEVIDARRFADTRQRLDVY